MPSLSANYSKTNGERRYVDTPTTFIIGDGSNLNGKKIGVWHEYEDNKIKIRVAFDEEERFSGLYKEYYPDGSLKEEYIYIKGKLVKILMNNREF